MKKVKFTAFLALLILVFALCLIGGCGKGEKTSAEPGQDEQTPVDTCPFDGAPLNEVYNQRALAVMIENHRDARPQSGLDKACVVLEIPAEGGITRFLAIYGHGTTDVVGPVRSARPYFIERALDFDGVYFHCGWSPQAHAMLKQGRIDYINEFYNGKYFWRSSERKAPHNLYTSTAKLREAISDKKFRATNQFSGFVFTDSTDFAGEPANSVVLNYPGKYQVEYRYDAGQKAYLRSMDGEPHLDKETGKQLSAKNVIVQYTSMQLIKGDGSGRLAVRMVGEGEGLLIQSGKQEAITWKKPSENEKTTYYDQNGNEIKLLPGPIWIQVMPSGASVTIE